MTRRMLGLVAATLVSIPALARAQMIEVANAWARGTPVDGAAAAVYLTLFDSGPPDQLTDITTPVAGMAMIHESYEDQGVSRMRMLETLPLPTGRPVVLKPGGVHIMLMGLKQKLTEGSHFPITLHFAKAPPLTVNVQVLGPAAAGPAESATPGMKMP